MQDESLATAEARDEVPEIPSHAHPEWIMSSDGRRLIDRPRNLREWVKQRIAALRRGPRNRT